MTIILGQMTIKSEFEDYMGASDDYVLHNDDYRKPSDDYPTHSEDYLRKSDE